MAYVLRTVKLADFPTLSNWLICLAILSLCVYTLGLNSSSVELMSSHYSLFLTLLMTMLISLAALPGMLLFGIFDMKTGRIGALRYAISYASPAGIALIALLQIYFL